MKGFLFLIAFGLLVTVIVFICIGSYSDKNVKPSVDVQQMTEAYTVKDTWGNLEVKPLSSKYLFNKDGTYKTSAVPRQVNGDYGKLGVWSLINKDPYNPSLISQSSFPFVVGKQQGTYNNEIITNGNQFANIFAGIFDPSEYSLNFVGIDPVCVDPDQICVSLGVLTCLGNQIYSGFPNYCITLDGTRVDGPVLLGTPEIGSLTEQNFQVAFYSYGAYSSTKIPSCNGRIGQLAFNVPTDYQDLDVYHMIQINL